MEGEHRVGQGAYREGRVVVPRAPSRGRPLVAVGAALVVTLGGAVNAARAWRRAAAAVTATPVADVTRVFVRDATRIVGGGRICAVTGGARRPGVTCLVENASVSGGKVVTWPGGAVESLTTDGRMMGVLRDGRGAQLRMGAKEAEPFTVLPLSTGSDRLVELRSSSGADLYPCSDTCRDGSPRPSSIDLLWARTARGTVIVVPDREDAEPVAPVQLPPNGVRSFAVEGPMYCAVLESGVTTCAIIDVGRDPLTRPAGFEPPHLADPQEIALRRTLLCVRNRVGAVECSDWHWRESYELAALPGGATAMALGDQDLCVRARDGAWWCARGPRTDAPHDGLRDVLPRLRPAPRLDGAEEVAFAPGVGCARWRSGMVRCWGPRAIAL